MFVGGGDIPVIIKPVQDTSSGIGVEKVQGIENIKKVTIVKKRAVSCRSRMYCSKRAA